MTDVASLSVPDRLRLGLRFDADAIAAEIAEVSPASWIPHFNKVIHEGEWSGVTLRGPGGDAGRIYPDQTGTQPVADTPVLDGCPIVAKAIASLQCPVLIARFLSLGPGSVLHPHSDEGLGFDAGTVRLHVPVVSDPEVTFELGGSPVTMALGECWYLDLRKPHSASNGSGRQRVHLVLDCRVDQWLTAVFAQALTAIDKEG